MISSIARCALFPVKFAPIVNLEIAKALRLGIPPTLLATTDEVIE